MFKKMRRFRQELEIDKCIEILNEATSGVLALDGDNGYPYAVPLSFAYDDGKIYFHCAKDGHKLDAIAKNDKCSFCVIGNDDVLPEKFTTLFSSVICFGTIKILESYEQKETALNLLARKYSSNIEIAKRKAEIDGAINKTCILVLEIEHMSGKQCIEYLKK